MDTDGLERGQSGRDSVLSWGERREGERREGERREGRSKASLITVCSVLQYNGYDKRMLVLQRRSIGSFQSLVSPILNIYR
jgi:hypothetical protein